jgi:hypothetical protein
MPTENRLSFRPPAMRNQKKRGNQDGKDEECYNYADQPRFTKPAAKHESGFRPSFIAAVP